MDFFINDYRSDKFSANNATAFNIFNDNQTEDGNSPKFSSSK